MRVGECISEEYNKICTVMASRASVCEERNKTLQFQRCDSAVKRLDHADRGVKREADTRVAVAVSLTGATFTSPLHTTGTTRERHTSSLVGNVTSDKYCIIIKYYHYHCVT